jgi:lipoyl-dependent peroxiredoxin
MPVRTANAVWEGTLREGSGHMKFGSGAFDGQYSFTSRFEEGTGTNPEELIGAAHAGCFSMAFSGALVRAGHTPTRIETTARVHINQVEGGFGITKVELDCQAEVPGIDEETFQKIAQASKAGCPVSKALAGTEIELKARRVQ